MIDEPNSGAGLGGRDQEGPRDPPASAAAKYDESRPQQPERKARNA